MQSTESERQEIVDYMYMNAPDETVEHLEKVTSERVFGRQIDIWDVHTNKERWWVITAPTNLYSQKQFPSMDVALSFHIGLTERVMEREGYASREHAERFPIALRKWKQAAEAFIEADEAEEFQSIGMRCRESLISFAKESVDIVKLDDKTILPNASDFNGWMDLIGNTVAAGASAERRRGYLKSTAKSTWELVNWLTHSDSATRFDAYFAYMATGHVLSAWALSMLRYEHGVPEKCPKCASYRLDMEYKTIKESMFQITVCEVCDWQSEPSEIPPPKPETLDKKAQEKLDGDCIIVEVPLCGPKPPKPRLVR
jgi:hypothetical protein